MATKKVLWQNSINCLHGQCPWHPQQISAIPPHILGQYFWLTIFDQTPVKSRGQNCWLIFCRLPSKFRRLSFGSNLFSFWSTGQRTTKSKVLPNVKPYTAAAAAKLALPSPVTTKIVTSLKCQPPPSSIFLGSEN